MEQKLVFSGGLKGIIRAKPSAFTSYDMFEEAQMAVLEAGGLYKLRKPLPSAIDGTTYRSIQNVANLRPRGMAYLESPTPSIVYWYGDKCAYVKPIESISDRIKFAYNADTNIWSGKGSADGPKYKWVKFHSAADDDYLFCCAGNALEWIKISDWTTGTVAVLPTTNCTAVWVKDGRLWCACDDKLFYSTVDDGLTFDATHFLRLFEQDTVCDVSVYNDVSFIFTDKYVYYMTGNDTADFIVKIMENTQCVKDSTFDSDSEGVYFMDKYANIRLISSSPNYNSAAKSLVISENLNLYDKFISNNLQYPSYVNVARNQGKIFVNLGVSTDFKLTNATIDCTQDTATDFKSAIWTESDVETQLALTDVKTLTHTAGAAATYSNVSTPIVKGNCDMKFEVTFAGASDLQLGIFHAAAASANDYVSKIYVVSDNRIMAYNNAGTNNNTVIGTRTNAKWYFRIKVESYTATTATVKYACGTNESDLNTFDVTCVGVDTTDANWFINLSFYNTTAFTTVLTNLLYVENGDLGSTSLDDIYNFIFDMKTKEWTEYANFDVATGLIREYPIEYMSPSKDRVLNTAQYLGCQYTETVGVYSDTKNYIGVFNQKGTTKDNSSFNIQSNAFNLETPNKKILREFYADFTPTDATVTLYLQNDINFGTALTSIMSIRSGWNTIPRIYRGRQFKYGLKTTETDEFQLKQIGFRFDDLGQKAF